MKRILIFDCWLPGYTYINELSQDNNVELLFVHTSSLQRGIPAKEYRIFKKQMDPPHWVVDFSEFMYSFECLFKVFKPDALLVLSLHHIEARTALTMAKRFDIATFFIPHGIFLLDYDVIANPNQVSFRRKFLRIISLPSRLFYYTLFFWRYFTSINEGRLRLNIWKGGIDVYFQMIGNFHGWQWKPSVKVQEYYGCLLDYLLLYNEEIEVYCKENYSIFTDAATFTRTGTLDSMRALRHEALADAACHSSGKFGYFISSPCSDYYSPEGMKAYIDVVNKLRVLCSRAACESFYYRPHPGEPSEFTEAVCAQAGVKIDWARDFAMFLSSEVICGTSSSMLYAAVARKKKIVIWNSNRLTVVPPYYEPLKSYPKALFDADLEIDENAIVQLSGLENAVASFPDMELKDPLKELVKILHR
jgi:hypothetical protein